MMMMKGCDMYGGGVRFATSWCRIEEPLLTREMCVCISI